VSSEPGAGHGDIFDRLAAHKYRHRKQLLYFSFCIISNKNHEREIETAVLRAAGGQMTLNEKKVRMGLEAGSVSDYEPGTWYFERQWVKGSKEEVSDAPLVQCAWVMVFC
jgi:hypothetical protein